MLAGKENRMYKITVSGTAFIPIKLTIRIVEAINRYLTLLDLKS
jgi:hypothetical protein